MNSQRNGVVYGYEFSEGGTSFYVFPRFWITEDRERGVVEAVPLSLEDYCASQPFSGGKKVLISKKEHDGLEKILNREGRISFLNYSELVKGDNGKKANSKGKY